jgi:UDP-3-O-[3-hydroxymyristoyl] glucosamine N-acyltransferase
VSEYAEIGDASYIGPGAVIAAGVRIGWGCTISAGAKIGQTGFGYELKPLLDDPDDLYLKPKPHPFGVVLEDFVDVGANACIDRGSWRDTRVGKGTKIDNLVHIAHNVITGQDCLIVAGAEVSGSCILGDRVYIGPNACVRERLTLGEGSIVGLGAVVVKHVPPGEVWAGNPARKFGPVTEWPPAPPKED